MKRKNLLLIIPELSLGGAQRSLSNLSLEFSERYNVSLVIFNKNEPVAYAYGGKLISLDVRSGKGVLNKIKSFVQRIVRLRRLKKDLDIDISISFLEGADYINLFSRLKDKVVLSIRGSKRYDETIEGKYSWLRNRILIPYLYKHADAIVTVNLGIANELRTFYNLRKVKIVTIGNFYNIDEIQKRALESRHKNVDRLYGDPVLVATGRLAPEKGLKKMLQIFQQLKQENRSLRFVIVGDGPELSELIEMSNQLNLHTYSGDDFDQIPDVLFLGSQPNVFKFLKGATLFLMNSSSEGFPNGLVEAMICGVPVVSADCPYGPREILAPEFPFTESITECYFSSCGILMPLIRNENDKQIWVDTLQNMLGNKDELFELAGKGMEKVGSFDQKVMVKQWYDLLEQA